MLPVARHANLHFVTPRLAVGGDLAPYDAELALRQLAEIEQLGITHVVDVRIEWDDSDAFAAEHPHIGYLHHGMDDAGQDVPPEWFETAVRWIEAQGPEAVVLTHCHMGINRGPSLGFAVLLSQGWDAVDAISAIRNARPQADVWYAADALLWHHDRHDTDPGEDLSRLLLWRHANPLDVRRLIRGVRASEQR